MKILNRWLLNPKVKTFFAIFLCRKFLIAYLRLLWKTAFLIIYNTRENLISISFTSWRIHLYNLTSSSSSSEVLPFVSGTTCNFYCSSRLAGFLFSLCQSIRLRFTGYKKYLFGGHRHLTPNVRNLESSRRSCARRHSSTWGKRRKTRGARSSGSPRSRIRARLLTVFIDPLANKHVTPSLLSNNGFLTRKHHLTDMNEAVLRRTFKRLDFKFVLKGSKWKVCCIYLTFYFRHQNSTAYAVSVRTQL